MTPFFVQIKCQLGKSYQVANKLAEAEIASEIYSTAGEFDLLVKFYVEAGTDIVGGSPEALSARQKTDIEKYRKIAAAAGIGAAVTR